MCQELIKALQVGAIGSVTCLWPLMFVCWFIGWLVSRCVCPKRAGSYTLKLLSDYKTANIPFSVFFAFLKNRKFDYSFNNHEHNPIICE